MSSGGLQTRAEISQGRKNTHMLFAFLSYPFLIYILCMSYGVYIYIYDFTQASFKEENVIQKR